MKVGLFLTPGAARAGYQAGAAQALVEEAGVHFDVIAGSSVGALNASFVATGQIDRMIEEWSRWRSEDVLRVDWRAILRGALWWAPSLMSNAPEKAVITRYIDEARLLPGVRLRIGLANLDSGEQDFFEWPGAEMRLADAVCAAVAVPVAVPPARVLGVQWADGLTVDGFPLEPILLASGVDRAFVVGVAPRQLAPGRYRNPYRVVLRAADLNQFSEPRRGLDRAEAGNRRLQRWSALRDEARRVVAEAVAGEPARTRLLDEVERVFDGAGFPVGRRPVEIVPILPEHEVRMQFGDFRPERSRAFIEQGRQDARRAVAALSSPGS